MTKKLLELKLHFYTDNRYAGILINDRLYLAWRRGLKLSRWFKFEVARRRDMYWIGPLFVEIAR